MYDAIIILGGSFTDNGELMPWVFKRLDEATKHSTKYYIVTSRSTYHKPPVLDERGFPIDECTIMANYLISKGISEDKILKEAWSLDTIGNAYGTLVFHSIPLNLEKILVITSDFHMPRSKSIFNLVYGLIPKNNFKLTFITTNSELEISEKERNSLIKWQKDAEKFKTINDLHNFIFTEHNAYKSGTVTKIHYQKEDLEMYLGL